MTVRELLDDLQGRDPDMEVYLTFERAYFGDGDDEDMADAPAFAAYVSLGRVFITTCEV